MNLQIMEQLERLAQAFPWETVDLWIRRQPAGQYEFIAYLNGDMSKGFSADSVSGSSPEEVVTKAIQENPNRDPERMRQKAIRELEEKLAKLKTAVFSLPPYIPNRELCEHNPELSKYRQTRCETVDVETVKEQVPF